MLLVDQRRPEGGAFLAVLDGQVEDRPGRCDGGRGDPETFTGQVAHQVVQARTFFTEQVLRGNRRIVEEQLGSVLTR